MINTIKYYYNLNIDDIKQIDTDYYFNEYILKYYYRNIDIELYNYLVLNNIYVHEIVYNKNNDYITIINNKPYILLKIKKYDQIDLSILEKNNLPINYKKIPDWASLWSIKIDYYENNIQNIKDDILKESFQYFIGMTENAILLFKNLNKNNELYISHLRFNNDIEFYSPLNIIVDYKMRDYAEYIKKEFYDKGKYYYEYIDRIINYDNYNNVMLFLIRMLFPTSFFDAYDNYLKNEKIDYSFYYKREDYEKYLKYIYRKIKNKYNIVSISWLK